MRHLGAKSPATYFAKKKAALIGRLPETRGGEGVSVYDITRYLSHRFQCTCTVHSTLSLLRCVHLHPTVIYDSRSLSTTKKTLKHAHTATYSPQLHVRVLFFAFSAECATLVFLFFCEMCGRVGNEMPGERKILVTKKWVQVDKKTMVTHLPNKLHQLPSISNLHLGSRIIIVVIDNAKPTSDYRSLEIHNGTHAASW